MIQLEIISLRQTGNRLNRQPSHELKTCPKCESALEPGATECLSCGVILPKILAQLEDPMQADFKADLGADFVYRWQTVLSDYENEQVHWDFINYCQQFEALEFAAYRYRRLVDIVNDDIAAKMLKRVEAMSIVELEDYRLGRFELPPQMDKFPRMVLVITSLLIGVAASAILAVSIFS